MRRLAFAIVAIALGTLAACQRHAAHDQKAPTAAALTVPAGAQHDPTFDVAGYYLPAMPIQVGNFKLTSLAMGSDSDFESWEKGEREGVFGPILIDFEDVTSPVETNELGQEAHKVTTRSIPDRYRLFPGEVSFAAKDPKLGDILFVGRYDQAALAKEKKEQTGQATVLTGALQVGSVRFENASFTFFEGD